MSQDGINYAPISSAESPYTVSGQVLPARQVIEKAEDYSSIKLGEPVVSRSPAGLKVTFYHVELKGSRAVSAGIASADSADGIHWQLEKGYPMSISLTGHSSEGALEARLSKLSSACAQM